MHLALEDLNTLTKRKNLGTLSPDDAIKQEKSELLLITRKALLCSAFATHIFKFRLFPNYGGNGV